MKIINNKYKHYIKPTLNVNTSLDSIYNYNLYIVYYINCQLNTNYITWIIEQLNYVKDFKSTVYLVATVHKQYQVNIETTVYEHFPNMEIFFIYNYNNNHEYPGILKVWELGQIHKSTTDIILYFHSKNITKNKVYQKNNNRFVEIILDKLDYIYEIFSIFSSIDKICINSGGWGWCWYNFWYARGSYINQVEKPINTQRRHYYEDWIGRKVTSDTHISTTNNEGYCYPNTLINCYQINKGNSGNMGYHLNLLGPGQLIPPILNNNFNLIDVFYHDHNNIKNGVEVTKIAYIKIKDQIVESLHNNIKKLLFLTASNKWVGDPCPLIVKSLTIRYRLNNVLFTKTINENETIYFNEYLN